MFTIDDKKMQIFGKCIDRWGEKSQIYQAMGECGEFIADAQNYNRGKIELESLLGEAVDVFIMMFQMRELNRKLFDKLLDETLQEIEKKIKGKYIP